MSIVSDTYEFRYNFGDTRLHLLEYLKRYNVDTYIQGDLSKVVPKHLIKFKCYKIKPDDRKERKMFDFPEDITSSKRLEDVLKNGKAPIIVLPVLVMGKLSCASGRNLSNHINYLVINRVTNELERFDIRKFHIDQFTMKLLYKNMQKSIFRSSLQRIFPKLTFESDLDVPTSFMARHPELPMIKDIFPLFAIAYLTTRCLQPKFTTEQIYKKITTTKDVDIDRMWKEYISVSAKMLPFCKEGSYPILESHKCLAEKSKTLSNMLVVKPVKVCPLTKAFNMLTNRCVNPDKIKDVNILLSEILKIDINPKSSFTHLGGSATILQSMIFVFSKHPHGFFVHPRLTEKTKKNISRDDFVFSWDWNQKLKSHILTIPNGMEEAWQTGFKNSAVRFLVILVSLQSSDNGRHANALIYDKQHNEFERFDGLGSETHDSYALPALDLKLQDWVGKLVPQNYKFFSPIDYCPIGVYQARELHEIGVDDTRGNCAVWRLWYIDIRLANPDLTRSEVIALSMNKLQLLGGFQKFIKAYQKYVSINMPQL
jgi:hypothetical protein